MMPASEEVVRQNVAVDVLLWCNEYALVLMEQNEPTAAAAVNLVGKHLARRIMEERCSNSGLPPYSP